MEDTYLLIKLNNLEKEIDNLKFLYEETQGLHGAVSKEINGCKQNLKGGADNGPLDHPLENAKSNSICENDWIMKYSDYKSAKPTQTLAEKFVRLIIRKDLPGPESPNGMAVNLAAEAETFFEPLLQSEYQRGKEISELKLTTKYIQGLEEGRKQAIAEMREDFKQIKNLFTESK